jgi:CheY-like chemotaxis protein
MSEHRAVLYVEDEAIIREFLVMALEDAGFEVVAAENGAAALEALDHNTNPFCAIVTDIQLGAGPDGWEVARRGRQLNHLLPVVYLTGAGGADLSAKGVSNSRMITKPFNFDEVIQAVIALIGKAA